MQKQNMSLCLLATTGLVLGGAASAHASSVTIDGRFQSSEGYTHKFILPRADVKTGESDDPAILWAAQDNTSHDLSLAFILPKTYVDNTYGVNSIGWGDDKKGKGKGKGKGGHKLKDLVGSDHATFQFTNGGQDTLDFGLDYITDNNDGTYSSGLTGNDKGEVKESPNSSNPILAAKTSLDFNSELANSSMYFQGKDPDSPFTDDNYTPNPNIPDWQFDVVYEFSISGAVFNNQTVLSDQGFTNGYNLTIEDLHASPNKGGNFENITPPPPSQVVPTPSAAAAGLLGLGALMLRRRRAHRV